ncbi:hypothetical protein [Mesorhizobium hawassense]|nr:hypothetical protein [Mesorhizobium hawassense]
MIQIAVLRDQLSLDRRSLTEIATALSVTAMAGATLYNLGFFAPVEWSLISVLTVQDLLIGASIALLPMSIGAWLALLIARFIANGPERQIRTIGISIALVGFGLAGSWYFYVGPHQSTGGHLALAYLALAGLAAIANLVLRSRIVGLAWLAFSLIYVPFSFGAADSLRTISNGAAPTTEIETDRGVVSGRVLRMTSAFAILFDGKAVEVLPLNKVRSMRRLYSAAPESEYLKNGLSEIAPLPSSVVGHPES